MHQNLQYSQDWVQTKVWEEQSKNILIWIWGIEAQERVKHTLNMNDNNVFVIVFADKELMKYVRGNSIT